MNIIRYRSDGTIEVEIEFTEIQQVFTGLAPIQEIFALARECGKCHSTNTRLGHKIQKNGRHRYEARCMDCNADLRFIERQDGGMFPDLKDRDGAFHPDKGWSTFVPEYQQSGSVEERHDYAGVRRPPKTDHPIPDDPNADIDPADIPF